MPHRKRMTRRRFLLMGGGTVLSAFMGGAYLRSGCPLSSSGVCVGPCAAFLDLNHDGICDRIQSDLSRVEAATSDGVAGAQLLPGHAQGAGQEVEGCPFGLVDDPYPGKCDRYVDENGDGFCDLSQLAADGSTSIAAPTSESPSVAASVPEPTAATESVPELAPTPLPESVTVACPFGLVNDPYPGKCKRYVDKNGNGFCDLSEPEPTSVPEPTAATESVPQPTPTPTPDGVTVACPFGLVNDPYPGECKRYVDKNGNGFCDLSEPGSGENEPQDVPTAREGEGRRRRGRGGGEE